MLCGRWADTCLRLLVQAESCQELTCPTWGQGCVLPHLSPLAMKSGGDVTFTYLDSALYWNNSTRYIMTSANFYTPSSVQRRDLRRWLLNLSQTSLPRKNKCLFWNHRTVVVGRNLERSSGPTLNGCFKAENKLIFNAWFPKYKHYMLSWRVGWFVCFFQSALSLTP